MANCDYIRRWGLSMYGGYYVNLGNDNSRKWEGKHFSNYKQLKEWAKENNFRLTKELREDNDI